MSSKTPARLLGFIHIPDEFANLSDRDEEQPPVPNTCTDGRRKQPFAIFPAPFTKQKRCKEVIMIEAILMFGFGIAAFTFTYRVLKEEERKTGKRCKR